MNQVCYLYRLHPGAEEEYERRHAEVWPELRALLDEAGIYDYTIFRRGTLLICVLCTRHGFAAANALLSTSDIQARWSESLRHLFAEIADPAGEPLWAHPVFRHDGR